MTPRGVKKNTASLIRFGSEQRLAWSSTDVRTRRKKRVRAFRWVAAAAAAAVCSLLVLSLWHSSVKISHSSVKISHSSPASASSFVQSVESGPILRPGPPAFESPEKNAGGRVDKYAKDRVYCMVPFIWNEDFYKVIMETWGKRCDVINFLTDAIVGGKLQGDKITDDPLAGYKPYTEYPPGTFPENVIFVNMTRPWNNCTKRGERTVCRHIWEKMWRSWVYVEENHADQAEWFCKVDYDTFFFPDNLKYYVRDFKNWDPYNEHHYFGHMLQHRSDRPPMIAGAAACWSIKTLRATVDVYRKMPKGRTGGERGKCEDRGWERDEITTSLCLKNELGIDAEAARDEAFREFVMIIDFNKVLTWNRTEEEVQWYWKGKPSNVGRLEDCCALRPIGLHKYKTVEEIQRLEKYFFGSDINAGPDRLNIRSLKYVRNVRKAMGIDH